MRRDDVGDAGDDFIALLFSLLLSIWIQQASKAWRCMCACLYAYVYRFVSLCVVCIGAGRGGGGSI